MKLRLIVLFDIITGIIWFETTIWMTIVLGILNKNYTINLQKIDFFKPNTTREISYKVEAVTRSPLFRTCLLDLCFSMSTCRSLTVCTLCSFLFLPKPPGLLLPSCVPLVRLLGLMTFTRATRRWWTRTRPTRWSSLPPPATALVPQPPPPLPPPAPPSCPSSLRMYPYHAGGTPTSTRPEETPSEPFRLERPRRPLRRGAIVRRRLLQRHRPPPIPLDSEGMPCFQYSFVRSQLYIGLYVWCALGLYHEWLWFWTIGPSL